MKTSGKQLQLKVTHTVSTSPTMSIHPQFNLPLKAKTRKRWTAEGKRELRRMLAEGKTTKEIAANLGVTMDRVRSGKRYHIKRVRKQNTLKRATTAALTQELIDRGNSVTSIDKGVVLVLGIVVLLVIVAIVRAHI